MISAGNSGVSTIDQTMQRASDIERQIGIPVPEFIRELPVIDETEAIRFAQERGLAQKIIDNRYRGDESHPDAQLFLGEAGLRFCRGRGITIQDAFALSAEEAAAKITTRELYETFHIQDKVAREELIRAEGVRRAKRDQDLLLLETALLQKRGITVPAFSNLMEYCAWVPEAIGLNRQYQQWELKNFVAARDVYWDLMEHYHKFILGAELSFDPMDDWLKYFTEELDIREKWQVQNTGKEDISYYSKSTSGIAAAPRPHGYHPQGNILTHTTTVDRADMILKRKYMIPRVCYSVQQVVAGSEYPRVVFFFDRQQVERTYSLEPHNEESHERELRSHELNHIGLCIGCVPLDEEIFWGNFGSGMGTRSTGRLTVDLWGKRYERTGEMWTPEEKDEIANIIRRKYR